MRYGTLTTAAARVRAASDEGIVKPMSDNPPPYQPPGGSQPYGGPPSGENPPSYPPGGGQGYPAPPPAYGPPQPAYGTPYGPPGQAGFGPPPGGAPTKRWYQRWWVWLVIVLGLIIVAIVVVAVVRGNKYLLESKIKDEAKKENVQLTNLHCPNDINTDKGHVYTCTADIAGKPASLLITFIENKKFTITQQ